MLNQNLSVILRMIIKYRCYYVLWNAGVSQELLIITLLHTSP